jgi:hypothetical protein
VGPHLINGLYILIEVNWGQEGQYRSVWKHWTTSFSHLNIFVIWGMEVNIYWVKIRRIPCDAV